MDWHGPILILIPVLWLLGSLGTTLVIFWVDRAAFRRRDWVAVLLAWPGFWGIVLGMALKGFFLYVRRKLRRSNRNVNEEDYYAGD